MPWIGSWANLHQNAQAAALLDKISALVEEEQTKLGLTLFGLLPRKFGIEACLI
jgi:hypothetical protein